MAEPEFSLDDYAEQVSATAEPLPVSDEDIQQISGFRSGQELTLDEYADGSPGEAEPPSFEAAEIEQEYRNPILKGLDVLSIPHKAIARKAVEHAPQIKSAVQDVLGEIGVDTSDWTPVDEDKWKSMMQAPELYGHDFVNLVMDKEKNPGVSRFLVGLMADFVDPALFVGNIGGISKKAIPLAKEGSLSRSSSEQFAKGERILGRIGPIEIKSTKIAPSVINKTKALTDEAFNLADQYTNGGASRLYHQLSFTTETPELRNIINEYRGAQNADTLETVRRFESQSSLTSGQSYEDLARAVDAQELPTIIEPQTISGKSKFKLSSRDGRPFLENVGPEKVSFPFSGKTFFDESIVPSNPLVPESDSLLSSWINKNLGDDYVNKNLSDLTPEKFEAVQRALLAAGHDGLDLSKTKFAKGRLGSESIAFKSDSLASFEPQFETAIKPGYQFPNQELKLAHDVAAESAWEDLVAMNKAYGWADESGNPTRGFGIWSEKQLKDLAESGSFNGPKRYYPRVLDPALDSLDKQTGGRISEMFGNVDTGQATFSGGSPYKARKYGELLTTESADKIRTKINDVLKEADLPPYDGPIFDLDPIRAATRRRASVRTHLNKKAFLDKVKTLGKTDAEFLALPKSEQLKYAKFELPRSTSEMVAQMTPENRIKVLGTQIDGMRFKQSDLDRIKDVMNFEPRTWADAALGAASTASRFFRQSVLLGPTYFAGNFKGNLMMNALTAPRPSALAKDYKRAFDIITDWKDKNGAIFNVAGKPMVADDLINMLARNNLWDSGGIQEVTKLGQEIKNSLDASKKYARQTGKMPPVWDVFKLNREFTELYADNHAKLASFINHLEAGYKPEVAAQKVADALFDFGDVSLGFEKARRVMPFITYPTKAVPQGIKIVGKYPWLPEFTKRFSDLYTKYNVTDDPIDENSLKNIAPTYYSYLFDPLISDVLPGGNMILDDLGNPFGTVEGLLQTMTSGPLKAIPGAEEFFLLNLNRDPNTGQMIDDVKGLQEAYSGNPGLVESLASSLFTEAIPKPIRFAISKGFSETANVAENEYLKTVSNRVANFIGNPYGAKALQKATKFRAVQDIQDEELGQYFTQNNFLINFAPDFFEKVVEKNDPEFYRTIGSVYRQHLKDVTFGFKKMTNADKEVFVRNYILDNKMRNLKNQYEGIILKRDASMDPNYGAQDIKDIDETVESIAKQKELLGKTADLIYNLGLKYRTEIKQGTDDLQK